MIGGHVVAYSSKSLIRLGSRVYRMMQVIIGASADPGQQERA
jgi:hypothetical protein